MVLKMRREVDEEVEDNIRRVIISVRPSEPASGLEVTRLCFWSGNSAVYRGDFDAEDPMRMPRQGKGDKTSARPQDSLDTGV